MARKRSRKRPPAATLDDYRRALQALDRGAPAAVTVVHGGQEYFRRRAAGACAAAVRRVHPEVQTVTFYGPGGPNEEALSVRTVLGELAGSGLFAREKLVTVRRAQRFLFPTSAQASASDEDADPQAPSPAEGAGPQALAAYVAQPAAGIYLVLECERLDRRTRLGKALDAHGHELLCPAVRYPDETVRWLQGLARERDTTLTPAAGQRLFVQWGAQPDVLAAELDKLAAFVSPAAQIGEDAVAAFQAGSVALFLWDLTNALEARDAARALRLARRVADQGLTDERGRRVDPEGTAHMALAALRTCLADIWTARDLLARGEPAHALEARLGRRASRAKYVYAAARRYSGADLHAAFTALAEALTALHDTGADPGLVLERAVLAACAGRSGVADLVAARA